MALSNEGATETLRRLRSTLGQSLLPGKGNDFMSGALAQLNWRELIHTSYFDVEAFDRLLAFVLHRQGMAALHPQAWTNEQKASARKAFQEMSIDPLASTGDVQHVGQSQGLDMKGGRNLSVRDKTLVSVAMLLGLVLAAMLLTTMILPWHLAVGLWAGVAALAAILAAIMPINTRELAAQPKPAADYESARERFAQWTSHSEAILHPRCEAHILDHGRKVGRAYVLVHGISNCPYSMVDFAPRLRALGHNVLVARMPQNGHLDNETDALRRLTARQLRAFADTSIDIAAGLGDEVVVVGISAGGVVAAWMAQNRSEIERAVVIAPAFGLSSFGFAWNKALLRMMLLVPNLSVWKDPLLRAKAPSRPHSYKRQSTRGMAEVMRLGLATLRQSRRRPACASAMTLVLNGADHAIDASIPEGLARNWSTRGAPVTRFDFPAEYGLPHEIIDPTEEGANPGLVYPKLIALAEQPASPTVTPYQSSDPALQTSKTASQGHDGPAAPAGHSQPAQGQAGIGSGGRPEGMRF